METREFVCLMHYNIGLAKSKGLEPTHITISLKWVSKLKIHFKKMGFNLPNVDLHQEPFIVFLFCGVKIIFSEGVDPEKMIIGFDSFNLPSKNKTTSKITLTAGDKQFELYGYQSPRGLRNDDKRPSIIDIEVKERFDVVGFKKYIKYLTDISFSMELETNKPEDVNKRH